MTLELPRLSIQDDGSGVRFLTDPALWDACGVRMGFTERTGGLSAAPFASLNLGRFAGEGEQAALANIQRLMASTGAADARLLNPKQVHGSNVLVVEEPAPLPGDGLESCRDVEADGVVVDAAAVFGLLCFADCVPVIIVAPTGAFALVHSGWRGTHAHIVPKALSALAQRLVQTGGFSSALDAAAQCNIYIGPYIHQECFEVGEDTYALFEEEFGSVALAQRGHVDLGAAIRSDLIQAGASEARILDAGICTVCSVDRFFSYRAEGGLCGRHGAFGFRK